jgi:hypothetical protein
LFGIEIPVFWQAARPAGCFSVSLLLCEATDLLFVHSWQRSLGSLSFESLIFSAFQTDLAFETSHFVLQFHSALLPDWHIFELFRLL